MSLGEEACVVAELGHEGKQLLPLRATFGLARGVGASSQKLIESALEPLDDALLPRLDALAQRLDPTRVSGPAQLPELLPKFHDFHEKIWICRALGDLAYRNPVTLEQELRALHGIFQQTGGFVYLDGLAESLSPLGRSAPRITIGVQRASKLTLALSELAQIEVVASRDTEQLEGIAQG